MPYKDFTVGQVLTSAEVDDFLMRQAVMVFDNSTQRGTALSAVLSEGMVTYLKDVKRLEQYDGTAWTNVAPDGLPAQAGNSGKYLSTDGTAASWSTIAITSDSNPQIFLLMGA